MTDSSKEYESNEYTATPSHILPAISKGGRGYICQECGHLEVTLDNSVFDELCPKCVIGLLKNLNAPRMVKVSEYFTEREQALEPTASVNKKSECDKTTIIIKKK